MARYTPIYGAFASRINEVAILCDRADNLSNTQNIISAASEINALCRASVVLLSSHVEAYIKELGEHVLDRIYLNAVCRKKIDVQFFYYASKERLDNIRIGNSPSKIAEHTRKFIDVDFPLWDFSQGGATPLPAPIPAGVFNAGFANPNFDKIKTYLNRFGYTSFRQDIFRKLTDRAQITINALDHIVDIRNSIAHGDPNATKTPNDVKDMISVAKLFCRTTDDVFSNWCKINLCTIR